MHDCIGKYYILNGIEKDVTGFDEAILQTNDMIYEVMRVEDGTYLFLEDYLARLEKTVGLSNLLLPVQSDEIGELLNRLIRINNCAEGPVKLMFSPHTTLAYLMKPYKPEPQDYISGVKTILLKKERLNPHVKYWNPVLRDLVTQTLAENNAFEAILVNSRGEITEGSRSNIFFVKDDELYTAPVSKVLAGITRMKVLEVCRNLDIPVIERMISFDEIKGFDSAFLTGTSRKVLPIREIGNIRFDPRNQLMKRISEGFDGLVQEYIKNAAH
ncbi:MAG: aminotransferase class IV [Bacteroidetes bacterium]|nr:aminotransferase class IV [Bacteroidota bacterium]